MANNEIGIGVDIGGTTIKYGLIDSVGRVLWSSEKPTRAMTSKKMVLENLMGAVDNAAEVVRNMGKEALSVGIGTPGLVNFSNVVLGGADNIKDWADVPLGQLIEKHIELPTTVCNDADAMAVAEFRQTCHGNETVVFITLGTGIGGAVFIKGKLLRGHHGQGGELGLFPIVMNGEMRYWEDIASTSALIAQYKEKAKIDLHSDNIDGKYIIEKYKQGEETAIKAVEEFIIYVGMGLAGYVNIFNPRKIILGGGISEASAFLLEGIITQVKKYALKECMKGVEIMPAVLGNKAGLIGAGIVGLKGTVHENQRL